MNFLRPLLIQFAIVAVVCGGVWWGLRLGEEQAPSKPRPEKPSATVENPAAPEQEKEPVPPLTTSVTANFPATEVEPSGP